MVVKILNSTFCHDAVDDATSSWRQITVTTVIAGFS